MRAREVGPEHELYRITGQLAQKAGLPMPRVFVTSAAARWGSCNSKREVRLATRGTPAEVLIIGGGAAGVA